LRFHPKLAIPMPLSVAAATTPAQVEQTVADLNEDGQINVTDLIVLINILLGLGFSIEEIDPVLPLLDLHIVTEILSSGIISSPYSDSVVAVGGEKPYTWSLVLGQLPDSLSLDSATGRISGIPTEVGTDTFTVQVTDSDSPPQDTTKQLTIFVSQRPVFRVERSTGDVFAQGSFTGGGADLAERINVSEPVEPGDVVELDPGRPGYYRKARSASSKLIAGVISKEPGFMLGNRSEESQLSVVGGQLSVASGQSSEPLVKERPLLALLGRVAVKATTENGPISVGDLLTVSASRPGCAMRSNEDSDVEEAIIGKALESLDGREGLIMVLVMSH